LGPAREVIGHASDRERRKQLGARKSIDDLVHFSCRIGEVWLQGCAGMGSPVMAQPRAQTGRGGAASIITSPSRVVALAEIRSRLPVCRSVCRRRRVNIAG
jgi:hypothetical protein